MLCGMVIGFATTNELRAHKQELPNGGVRLISPIFWGSSNFHWKLCREVED